MKHSRVVVSSVAVAAVGLVWVSQAHAGSDIYSNIAPGTDVPGGGLAHRYPLGHFSLDRHFKAVEASLTGGVDVSGVPAMIAHFLASVVWELTAFVARTLIDLFAFAFSLDLVTGSEATGGVGALEPVAGAIRRLYAHTFGEPWLVVAIVVVGLWALWQGLVQRRYTQTAGALGISLIYLVIAMAFVTQPERTIGEASRWTNQMSAAFLALSSRGRITDEHQAKRAASDQLFSLLVYQPWVVLNFGGLEHCVRAGTGDKDSDPVSLPVRPLSRDAGRDRALRARLRDGTRVEADHGKTCINNQRKYAARFLTHGPGSHERDAEYEALNDADTGKLTEAARSREYRLAPEDKPATDAMEQGGQYQRLLMALVVFVGELGAFLLLGSLAVGVVLAQVVVLLLLAFAPVVLVVGVFPGRGHDVFRAWLVRLAGFLVRKAIYSLILAVLLTVSGAVAQATGALGWLFSFGLQAAFFWSVLIWRRQLTGHLLTATVGAVQRHEGRTALQTLYYAGSLLHRHRPRRTRRSDPPPPPQRRGGGRPPAPGGPGPRPPRPPTHAADRGADPPVPRSQPPAGPPTRPNRPRSPARPVAEPHGPHDGPPVHDATQGNRPPVHRADRPLDPHPDSHLKTPGRGAPAASSPSESREPSRGAGRPASPSEPQAESGADRVLRPDVRPAAGRARDAVRAPAPGRQPSTPFAAGEAANPLLVALRRDRERVRSRQPARPDNPVAGGDTK